jgi:hypothetical protein
MRPPSARLSTGKYATLTAAQFYKLCLVRARERRQMNRAASAGPVLRENPALSSTKTPFLGLPFGPPPGKRSALDVAVQRAAVRRKLHVAATRLRAAQAAVRASRGEEQGARGRSRTPQVVSYTLSDHRGRGRGTPSFHASAQTAALAERARERSRTEEAQRVRAASASSRPGGSLLKQGGRPAGGAQRRRSTPSMPLPDRFPAVRSTGPGPASYAPERTTYTSNAHAAPVAFWGKGTGREEARAGGQFRSTPRPPLTALEVRVFGAAAGVDIGAAAEEAWSASRSRLLAAMDGRLRRLEGRGEAEAEVEASTPRWKRALERYTEPNWLAAVAAVGRTSGREARERPSSPAAMGPRPSPRPPSGPPPVLAIPARYTQ